MPNRGFAVKSPSRRFKRLFRNGGAFAHLLAKLNGSRSALLAEKPQFVVAGAAYADVLEMIGTDQDVVAGHQVHHPQKHGGRHIAGEGAAVAGLEVDYHGMAQALRHDSGAPISRW